ncbi:MAG: 30S ribosomal protein S9 [Candidatus Levybacteria bacterium]|nr:30S ribosomal protein S9 [Candidatus Levybacteria bacterium]
MAEENIKEEKEQVQAKKVSKKDYVHAIGRRREATARVRLYTNGKEVSWGDQVVKKGEIFVNEKPIEQYFSGEVAKSVYIEPFRTTNTISKFTVTAKVEGGGKHGQLQAFVHAISRALSEFNTEKFRPVLKKKGLLTRDARARQRRKVGMGGKSRRKKQSPKR